MNFGKTFYLINTKLAAKTIIGKNMTPLNSILSNLKHSLCAGTFLKQQNNPQTFQLSTTFRPYSNTSRIICLRELRILQKTNKVVIIDLRPHEETLRTGTIPGALCIPYSEIESALSMQPEDFQEVYCMEKPDPESQVVLVCRKGNRSYKTVRILCDMGYENCKSLQGGFIGWFEQKRVKREKKCVTERSCDQD